ncbi:MAG: hypothetical protein H7831_17725 [Magnetococcus sp. WYHC-3]
MNRGLLAIVVVVIAAAAIVVVLRKPSKATPPPLPQPVSMSAVAQVTPSNTPPETAAATNKAAPPPEPPYVPPAVGTPALSNVVNERASFEDRVNGLTSGKVPEVKNPQDLDTLAKQLSNPNEDEVVRHEIVNLLFRSDYQGLEPLFFKILENPAEDQKFRAWTVQHIGGLLTTPGNIPVSPDLLNRVRKILSDSDVHVRREALLALSRANDTKTLEGICGLLTDQAPGSDGMRDLAIRIAQTKNLREQIPCIRPYLTSTNDTIRIAAIVALSQWGDQESRPAIEVAATSSVVRVQLCAKAALARLNTQALPK